MHGLYFPSLHVVFNLNFFDQVGRGIIPFIDLEVVQKTRTATKIDYHRRELLYIHIGGGGSPYMEPPVKKKKLLDPR